MVFMNINLDWLTCIHEFGVPLQLVNMTWFTNIQKNWQLWDIEPTIINLLVLTLR
jgi:hypothetical protein